MYARAVAGQVLEFGVSGKLLRNVLVMYDRQTDSLWSQLLGAAISGPLMGTELTMLPALHTSWSVWRRQHPDGLLLRKAAPSYSGYRSYWRSETAGKLGARFEDERVSGKQFVVGILIGGRAKAYPYSRLDAETVVNDTFEGAPLLVVFHDRSATGVIYSRQVRGQTLSFQLAQESDTGMLLTDEETASTWNGLSGVATQGALAGQRLTTLPTTSSFWFGWKDHFPSTAVYGSE